MSVKKCKYCQKEIDSKASRCPHCQGDLRNWFVRHPIITGIIVLMVLGTIATAGSQKTTTQTNSSNFKSGFQNEEPKKTTVADLMDNNNPDVKRLTYTRADFVGKTFTLYVMAKASNYYNFGFRDENKYYSFTLWDKSVSGEYNGVYAYLDKTDSTKKAKELLDILLKENAFLKIEVSIPVEKYQESSNSFLEINNWEIIPTN